MGRFPTLLQRIRRHGRRVRHWAAARRRLWQRGVHCWSQPRVHTSVGAARQLAGHARSSCRASGNPRLRQRRIVCALTAKVAWVHHRDAVTVRCVSRNRSRRTIFLRRSPVSGSVGEHPRAGGSVAAGEGVDLRPVGEAASWGECPMTLPAISGESGPRRGDGHRGIGGGE